MAAAQPNRAIVLGNLPEPVVQMLLQIPLAEELGSPDAEERLFPEPSSDSQMVEDWKAYVQPGLLEAFRSDREVVASDLKRMRAAKGQHSLEIPLNHADAWLGALNQLRLAIATVHQLSDAELSREEVGDVQSPRDLAVVRVHFYGYLQHVILDALED